MNQIVAKTPELALMLETIRENHIDIIPLIVEEVNNSIVNIITDVVYETYINMED